MITKKIMLTASLLFAAIILTRASEAKIQIKVTGEGEPIVFLPGFGCPGEVWDETIASFEDNYSIHVISYPGFSGIPAPDTMWYKTVLNQIKDYVSTEFEEKPIVVGHSLGGTFALDLESNAPTFSKIILVDVLPSIASVMMPGVPIENIRHDSPYNKQLLAMDDKQFESMQLRMAANMSRNAEKHELIANWMVQADRKTYAYGYTDLLKIDLREKLSEINVPVLVLMAVSINMEQTRQITDSQYAKLDNKKVAYIENSGHFIMFDQLDWLISKIKSFI